MADFVLTTSSSVACSHNGTIKPVGVQQKLKAGGAFVLVDGDFSSATISSCSNPTDSNTGSVQCQTSQSQTGGTAQKLKVNGKPVLLKSVQGQTSGFGSGGTPVTYSASDAKQQKLKAS
jgi:hypothetical protein